MYIKISNVNIIYNNLYTCLTLDSGDSICTDNRAFIRAMLLSSSLFSTNADVTQINASLTVRRNSPSVLNINKMFNTNYIDI